MIKNDQGRATKNHQSVWDIEVKFKATPISMTVGLTAQKWIRNDLLAAWWRPTGKRVDKAEMELLRAVFFDIVEGAHLLPKKFEDVAVALGAGHTAGLLSAASSASASGGPGPATQPLAREDAAADPPSNADDDDNDDDDNDDDDDANDHDDNDHYHLDRAACAPCALVRS